MMASNSQPNSVGRPFLLFQGLTLVGFAVFGIHLGLERDWPTAWTRVGGFASASLISAAAAALLLLLAARRPGAAGNMICLWAALLLFIATNMLTWLPSILAVPPGLGPSWSRFNWIGKVAVLGYALLSFALLPAQLRRATGLFANPRPGSWRATLIALGGFLGLGLALALAAADPREANIETLVFQATLPSITEEPVFRGLLAALFAGVLDERWVLAGARIGWGWLACGLLFGLVHGLVFSPAHGLLFQPVPILATAVLGLMMGWLVARCGALWPAMLAHSFINATGPAVGLARALMA